MSLLVVAVQGQRHALRRRPAGRIFFIVLLISESILGEGWLYKGLAAEAACSPSAQSLRSKVQASLIVAYILNFLYLCEKDSYV